MFDVALNSAGAQVCLATSSDENFPPENMIDGRGDTFWTTTGMFPQQFIISFQALMNLGDLTIQSCNIRKLVLERCVQNDPLDFELLEEREFPHGDSTMQKEEFELKSQNKTAQHIRITIPAAYDHFVAVYKVNVNGTAVHGA